MCSAQGPRPQLRREKGNKIVSGHGEQEGLSHNTVRNIGRSPGQKSTFQAKIENSKYPQQKLAMSTGQQVPTAKVW